MIYVLPEEKGDNIWLWWRSLMAYRKEGVCAGVAMECVLNWDCLEVGKQGVFILILLLFFF